VYTLIKNNQSKKRSANKLAKARLFNDLLNGMDKETVDSFTPKQLSALKASVNKKQWRSHSLDFRPTLGLPLIPWNFYMVFQFGVNKRDLSASERFMAVSMLLLVVFIIGLTIIGLIFLLLYLVKSALGIDIFPNESMGIWDEFKRLFQ
jgi:hypothetical protein